MRQDRHGSPSVAGTAATATRAIATAPQARAYVGAFGENRDGKTATKRYGTAAAMANKPPYRYHWIVSCSSPWQWRFTNHPPRNTLTPRIASPAPMSGVDRPGVKVARGGWTDACVMRSSSRSTPTRHSADATPPRLRTDQRQLKSFDRPVGGRTKKAGRNTA